MGDLTQRLSRDVRSWRGFTAALDCPELGPGAAWVDTPAGLRQPLLRAIDNACDMPGNGAGAAMRP